LLTAGRELAGGWPYEFTQPLNGGSWTDIFYTPRVHIVLPGGTYAVEESFLPGWTQTAAYVDGIAISPSAKEVTVLVSGAAPGETHEVIFGNRRLSQ
jgi:hypothetical protein